MPMATHALTMLQRLEKIVVEKPWGRTDIPKEFGEFGGQRIGEIWFAHPDGDAAPFMIKFLFTSERLSIQVHPDNAAAQAAGLPRGKEECWLVLDARPGAELGVGLNGEITREELHDAALDGSIVDRIDWRRSKTNDFVYNQAGTIHAIGPGLTIVEIQQNVDCTYRIYDYGRARELHLDEGLKVSSLRPSHDPRDQSVDPTKNAMLVDGPHFRVLQLADQIDPAIVSGNIDDWTVVPLSSGCSVDGELIHLGEAVLIKDPRSIELMPDSRALLIWS